MKKRLISMLILIAYLIISFPVCVPALAAQTIATVSYYSPAIKADVGDTVDLSGIGVEFESGVLTEADAITWASDVITISDGKITVAQKGTYKLTATSGDKTKTVYLLAKNPEDKEYVIFEDDFNVDKTLEEFKASGYTVPAKPSGHTIAVANGSLNFNTSTTKTTSQIVLPTWIGDFGNYSISADITVTEDYNTTQYFALTFRGQNELSYAPFYHTAYRSGTTTDCFELCHKYINTSGSDSWGTALKASYSTAICDSVQRNYRVDVVGDNVKNFVDGELIHDEDYIPASANGHIEYYKGNVGMLVKGCDVQVDKIKVVLKDNQESFVEYASPVIKANVGDIIPIDAYGVEFEQDVPTAAADVDWASDDVAFVNGQIAATAKGTYKLTATSGDKTKNVYLLVKNPDDDEYVIYENDFEVDKTKAELVEDGFKHAEGHTTHVIAVEDGALKISAAMGNKTTRFVLPAWIGDFGNYSISADVKITDKYATKQYFGLSFRGQQELGNAPFYNTTYRTEASATCFELCHKYIKSGATTSTWATATTAGYDESISDGVQRNFRVNVFDTNVKNFVDGQLIHDIDYIPKSANGNIEYYKGTVGLIVKGCNVEVDKITVTLMEKESDGIMTHVEDAPESNVQPAPMSVLSVDSESDFDFEKAPTVAMFRANAALDLVNAEGATVMTLADAITRLDGKIIPAFRVDDASAVDAICEFIQKNFLTDAFIVSSDAEIIKSARAKLPMLRGVLDFSAATITDIYDVRKQTNESGSLICLLPESHADRKNVDYLLRLYMNVWVTMKEDTNVGAVAAITSGANGVVTGDVDLYNNALVTYFDNKTITRPVIVSGHRGAYYSEQTNTIAGILKAYELGAMSSEIDIRLTSDGVIILMHDSTIDRETTGSGTVSEMTYEEISQYQVDYTTAVTETRPVATFAEALAAVKDLDDYQLFVEIKDTNTEICQKIADLINEYDAADKINIIAYEGPIIAAMREAMPEMSIGLLPETSKADDTDPEIEAYNIFNKLKTYNVFYAPNYEKIGLETLKALTDRGIGVGAWTLNGKAVLNNHLTSGFASVTTNTITSFTNVNAKKWISTDSAEYNSDTGIVDVGLTATTYTRETVAVDNAKLVFIDGDDIFSYANGKIIAEDNGSATLMLTAEFDDLNGGKINVVTEPFKVTVDMSSHDFTTRDDSADVIKNDAVAVIAKAQDLAAGSEVVASWKGVGYKFVVGANAFATVEEALTNTDATQIIIPSTDTAIEVNISRSVDIYGENYDVMPWVVDGDDVVKSEAWGASGVSTVSKVNVTNNVVGATIKVMGVDITGRILDYVRSASDEKTDITIENTILYKNTSTGTTEFNLANKNNAKSTDGSKTNTDSFTIKNMLFINNAPHTEGRFFTEGQPAYFTIDGFACNDNMQTFGYPKWGKNVKAGKMTVTNCYIKNNKSTSSDYTPLVYFSGHNASTYTAEERSAMDIGIEVSNNTLVDCGNPVTTVSADCGSTLGVLEIYPGVFKTIDIINNEFISTGDDSTKIITWKGSETTATNNKDFSDRITFTKNKVIGYLPAVHVNNLTTVDLSGNYFETALDDFKAGAPGDTPADVDADTYIDYDLTTKRSDMLPQSDALGLKTLMTIDTVYGYSAGNITAFDFTNANGVTYKVYSDAECANEIASLDVTVGNASKAYVKATKGDISLVYTLIVIGVKDMADVANAKTSIEGIDDAALYYPSLYAQPNGIEVVTYYNNEAVKFTTGENVVTSQAQFGVFGDDIVIPDDITEVTFDILTKVSFHSAQEITTNFTKRKAKIAFVGDSIVEGRVVPEGTDQATFEYAYPAVVQNILGTTDFEIKNYGQSGRTVTSTAAIFNGTERSYKLSSASKTKYENSIAYNGDVVVISLGANDVNWAFWTSNDRLIQSYVDLVRDYQALPSKPTIYIQTATPRYDGTTLITARVAENLRHIQRVVADITGAQVIDSYNLMFDLFSAGGTEYSDDKLHPNKAGYEIYGTRMANVLSATYTGASCQIVDVNGEDTLNTHTVETIDVKEPTCTEPGYTDRTLCSECGEIFEAGTELPVVDHTPVTDAGKAPTCIEAGLTEGSHCDVCGKVLVEQVEIPVSDHNIVKVDGKQATSEETGYKEHYKCEVCGKYFEDEAATKEIADIEAWKTGDGVIEFKAAVNETTGKIYDSFAEALADTKAGETLKLTSDATARSIVVLPKVTLDLNGYSLTVDYFVGLAGSQIVDNGATVADTSTGDSKGLAKTGKIFVKKNSAIISKNNAQLPLYDGTNGCYVFIKNTMRDDYIYYDFEKGVYVVTPIIGDSNGVRRGMMKTLLGSGNIADSGFTLEVRVSWETYDDTTGDLQYKATQSYAYNDMLVSNFINGYGKNGSNYDVSLSAVFKGDSLKQADYVYVSTVLVSSTGVEIESSVTTIDSSLLG